VKDVSSLSSRHAYVLQASIPLPVEATALLLVLYHF
jgi:hypothetical protein